MATILDKIKAYKLEDVARRKSARPLPDLDEEIPLTNITGDEFSKVTTKQIMIIPMIVHCFRH
jgi:hypothetical protein